MSIILFTKECSYTFENYVLVFSVFLLYILYINVSHTHVQDRSFLNHGTTTSTSSTSGVIDGRCMMAGRKKWEKSLIGEISLQPS